jgi:hypothetical protein
LPTIQKLTVSFDATAFRLERSNYPRLKKTA